MITCKSLIARPSPFKETAGEYHCNAYQIGVECCPNLKHTPGLSRAALQYTTCGRAVSITFFVSNPRLM